MSKMPLQDPDSFESRPGGGNPLEAAREAENKGKRTSLTDLIKVVRDEYLHGKVSTVSTLDFYQNLKI